MTDQPSLSGQVALVTGGAMRIGRATALALASAGAGVAIHYSRSAQAAEKLADDLRDRGSDVWTSQADFESQDETATLVPRVREMAGRLDILINNASLFPTDTIADANLEQVIGNMTVNTWAPFSLGRSFSQQTESGVIINFLDTRIAGYDFQHLSYILSKNTLALLTRMMALEFAPGVRVNAIAPGLILPPPGQDQSYLRAQADTVPLKRHGGTQDIADTVLFLIRSQFITGQTVYVDGGRHLLERGSG